MINLNKLIDKPKQECCLRKTPGIVMSYDSDTAYARVKLTNYNDIEMSFLNQTLQELKLNDQVQIWYFTEITAGFIGLKCGAPSTLISGGVKVVKLTKTEYKALEKKSTNILYYVTNGSTVEVYLGTVLLNGGGASKNIVDSTLVAEKSVKAAKVDDASLQESWLPYHMQGDEEESDIDIISTDNENSEEENSNGDNTL